MSKGISQEATLIKRQAFVVRRAFLATAASSVVTVIVLIANLLYQRNLWPVVLYRFDVAFSALCMVFSHPLPAELKNKSRFPELERNSPTAKLKYWFYHAML